MGGIVLKSWFTDGGWAVVSRYSSRRFSEFRIVRYVEFDASTFYFFSAAFTSILRCFSRFPILLDFFTWLFRRTIFLFTWWRQDETIRLSISYKRMVKFQLWFCWNGFLYFQDWIRNEQINFLWKNLLTDVRTVWLIEAINKNIQQVKCFIFISILSDSVALSQTVLGVT